jgi:hypothetical protein
MSDRLRTELVAVLAVWAADSKPTTFEVASLANEVLDSRRLLEAIDKLVCADGDRRAGSVLDDIYDLLHPQKGHAE